MPNEEWLWFESVIHHMADLVARSTIDVAMYNPETGCTARCDVIWPDQAD